MSIEALVRATIRSLKHPQVMNVSDGVFSNLALIAEEAAAERAVVVPMSRQHAFAMIAGALQYLEAQDGR